MQNIFRFIGYNIYFLTNENREPVNVHISKGKPNANATKIWIIANGGVIVCHNKSRIPANDLSNIKRYLEANTYKIISLWCQTFGRVTYYC